METKINHSFAATFANGDALIGPMLCQAGPTFLQAAIIAADRLTAQRLSYGALSCDPMAAQIERYRATVDALFLW